MAGQFHRVPAMPSEVRLMPLDEGTPLDLPEDRDNRDHREGHDDREEVDEPERKRMSKKDERMMAMFCHLGGILGGFILPLVIWLIKKDESRYIDYHGKEALNFQI